MELKLEGKVALVTGSTSGIGRATALGLAVEGVSVIVHGRDADRANLVVEEIVQNRGKAQAVLGDLRDGESANRLAGQALDAFGRIDILVNNSANGGKPARWFEDTDADWRDLIDSNALGAVRLIKALVPAMRDRGWGRVINIGSAGTLRPNRDFAAYSASKSLLNNMTVSLSMELGGTGVTVNTVSPGGTMTEAMEAGLRQLAEANNWPEKDIGDIERRAVKEMFPCPAGRFGRPEEVAALIAFVASVPAAYINDANLRVDGGFCETVS